MTVTLRADDFMKWRTTNEEDRIFFEDSNEWTEFMKEEMEKALTIADDIYQRVMENEKER